MLDLNKQVNEWKCEYGLVDRFIETDYKWINKNTLGICHFEYYLNTRTRYNKLYVTDVFKDYPIASKAVLWHEFCHAEVWLKEGKSDGHGSAWVGRLWRKPILFLLDYTYAKVLFEIVKNRHKEV